MLKVADHHLLYEGVPEEMTAADRQQLARVCGIAKRAASQGDDIGILEAVTEAMQGLSHEAVEDVKVAVEEVLPSIDPEFAKVASNIARGLGLLLGTGTLLRSGLNKAQRQERFKQSFMQMLQRNPHLKDRPNEVSEAFQVLSTYAPSLAVDPIASGHFVSNVMRLGQGAISPAMIKELIETESAKSGDPQAQMMDFARSLMSMRDQ